MCVCACVPAEQFTIHYFAIHNIRSQFQFLYVRFALGSSFNCHHNVSFCHSSVFAATSAAQSSASE